MNINEKIAQRIKSLRNEKRFTAEKLAWTAELSKSCISYTEKGSKDVKLSTINAICNAMNITLADFFSVFTEKI